MRKSDESITIIFSGIIPLKFHHKIIKYFPKVNSRPFYVCYLIKYRAIELSQFLIKFKLIGTNFLLFDRQ